MEKHILLMKKKAELLDNIHDTSEESRTNGPVQVKHIAASEIFSENGPYDLGLPSEFDNSILKRRSVTSSQTLKKVHFKQEDTDDGKIVIK